ncbi:hypothetical protein [Paratractidigestivibacter sp.]|uniref:hypothetical protein n=1 Tax=Paratractidigestivibacter sp. TaxID=2847316 RepID=UPI002ABDF55A|nr:hypothetical protein [Paratractidigestivibacter sp.]
MGKVHKSIRIDEAVDARVRAVKLQGESDAAAYERAVVAGLDVLERNDTERPTATATETQQEAQAAPDGGEGPEGATEGATAVVAALEGHIADLRKEVSSLRAQLEKKDDQIDALQTITTNAQALHGAADVLHAQALEDTQPAPLAVARPRGRWARAWAALTGKDEERG